MHVVYLHGFTSSPDSSKARYLRDRLARVGIDLHVPDFNQPEFRTLTVTRMLGQLDETVGALTPGPIVLVGSSLGGYVALHAAARRAKAAPDGRPITRLVLLAPALDFGSGRDASLSAAEVDEWRRTGWRNVFHHAHGHVAPVHYALWDDASGRDAFEAAREIPTLIFQGRRDEVVRPEAAEAYAATQPNVTLCLLDDDHQLGRHLDQVWAKTAAFLGLEP